MLQGTLPRAPATAFLAARDFLLRHGTDYDTAVRRFRWPVLDRVNRALDYCFLRKSLAPYQRIRRLEFAALPKTIAGKIRRVELRTLEAERRARGERTATEFPEDDVAS